MKKSFMERWVKALRSGKYKQVKNKLKDQLNEKEVGYCCLGVACTLTRAGRFVEDEEYQGDGSYKKYYAFQIECDGEETDVLPQPVKDLMQMIDDTGTFTISEVKMDKKLLEKLKLSRKKRGMITHWLDSSDLAELNDGGATFKEIARFIEQNYKKL